MDQKNENEYWPCSYHYLFLTIDAQIASKSIGAYPFSVIDGPTSIISQLNANNELDARIPIVLERYLPLRSHMST